MITPEMEADLPGPLTQYGLSSPYDPVIVRRLSTVCREGRDRCSVTYWTLEGAIGNCFRWGTDEVVQIMK